MNQPFTSFTIANLRISRLIKLARGRWHPLWRLRQLSAYRQFQRRFDYTVYTRIPETGIRVSVKGLRDASWIVSSRSLEPEVRSAFALVLDLVRPSVFWDIGANIGFYSWVVRQHPAVQEVVMFEPDPTNFALLNKTIRKNAILNCRTMNVAVSDCCGEALFRLDRASGAAGSLAAIPHLENSQSLQYAYNVNETITSRTVAIDALIADGWPAPSLIKIDVEGAEHLVLAGARSYLRGASPAMIIETRSNELVEELSQLGYRVFRIDADNLLFLSARACLDFELVSRSFPEYASTASSCREQATFN
jgi:FkbM family methyltransferase